MPSFPEEHYGYYILMMTDDKLMRRETTLSSTDMLSKAKQRSNLWISACFAFTIILLTIGIFCIFGWSHWLNYYAQQYTTNFYAWNLHYIMDILACIFFTIDLFHVFTISVSVIDAKSPYYSNTINVKIFLTYLAMLICVFCPVIYMHNTLAIDPGFTILLNDNDIVNCDYCGPFSPIYFYYDAIMPGLIPLSFFIIYKICCHSNKRKTNHSKSFEMRLIESNEEIQNEQKSESFDINISPLLLCILFLSLWWITWILLHFIFTVFDPKIIRNDFELGYVLIFGWTTISKFFHKRLARKYDYFRMKYNNKYSYYICMEYFIEWFYSNIYWNWIRGQIAFNTPEFGTFCWYLLIHLIFEIFQTNIRFSKKYYKFSWHILDNYLKPNKEKQGVILYNVCYFCYESFYSTATMLQWHDRMSLDMVLRILSAIFNGVGVCVWLLSMGQETYKKLFVTDNFNQAIFYCYLSTIIEIVYYTLTWLINLIIAKYNIFTPFVYYVTTMSTSHLFIFSIIWASSWYSVWMLN